MGSLILPHASRAGTAVGEVAAPWMVRGGRLVGTVHHDESLVWLLLVPVVVVGGAVDVAGAVVEEVLGTGVAEAVRVDV